MFKSAKKFVLACVCVLIAQNGFAASPVSILEKAASQVLSALQKHKANLRSNPQFVYQVVNRYIIPHVDINGLSRSVIGRRAWMGASSQQRSKFATEFTQLVVRTYSGALRDYSGEKIKFLPLRRGYQGKRFVKVSSFIARPNGQNISLRYSLVSKSGAWKVYDMSVEGVSLLQSFRSQFRQELRQGSFNQLIAKLHRKNRGG